MSVRSDLDRLERQRAERVAAARKQLMLEAQIESSRSPEEIACRAGTASLEQFEVGCESEVRALRNRCLSLSVVLITAVAYGLPVRHSYAALGYPPGVAVPKAHTTELLALARLAPPLKEGLQSESKSRRERRLAASVESRVQAGVAVSVLGDSVANKLRRQLWVRADEQWHIPYLDNWHWDSRNWRDWGAITGLSCELEGKVDRGVLDSRLFPAVIADAIVRFGWRGETPPSWSEEVKIGRRPPPGPRPQPKSVSQLIRERNAARQSESGVQ